MIRINGFAIQSAADLAYVRREIDPDQPNRCAAQIRQQQEDDQQAQQCLQAADDITQQDQRPLADDPRRGQLVDELM
jgi:hypothetical protein